MGKNVLLFGSKFDPVHIDHIKTAFFGLDKAVSKFEEPHDLWLLLSYSMDYGQVSLGDTHHRLNMLNKVVDTVLKDWPHISVCTYEIDKANGAGTYAVVRDLRRLYPDINFKFLMGADQAYNIRSWRNSRKLVKTIPFLVVPRFGAYNMSGASWFHDAPHTFVRGKIKRDSDKVNSTNIRQAFRTSRAVLVDNGSHGHLFPDTYRYILENGLYSGASNAE